VLVFLVLLGAAGCSFAPDLDGAQLRGEEPEPDVDLGGRFVTPAPGQVHEVVDVGLDLWGDFAQPQDQAPDLEADVEVDLPSGNLVKNLCGQAVGDEDLQQLCQDSGCQSNRGAAFCGQEDCRGDECACASGAWCSQDCDSDESCAMRCEEGSVCGFDSDWIGRSSLTCEQGAACHHSCNHSYGCETTCEAGASCEAVCRNSSSCEMTCEAGSICAMLCSDSSNCELECEEGAQCLLILDQDRGSLTCQGEAQAQGCQREGVSTCNLACP
jgi:hypothetical protein